MMYVELHINDHVAFSSITDHINMESDAENIYRLFHVKMLNNCSVPATVFITGVQSRMNRPDFEIEIEEGAG